LFLKAPAKPLLTPGDFVSRFKPTSRRLQIGDKHPKNVFFRVFGINQKTLSFVFKSTGKATFNTRGLCQQIQADFTSAFCF